MTGFLGSEITGAGAVEGVGWRLESAAEEDEDAGRLLPLGGPPPFEVPTVKEDFKACLDSEALALDDAGFAASGSWYIIIELVVAADPG